jgi:putative ABC transport system permease protein
VIVSMLLGTIVTLVASIAPAMKATRVPPIAAVREGATLPKGRFSSYRTAVSLSVVALSLALLGYGLFADGIASGPRLLSLAVGVLALFVGVGLAASNAARPLASILGRPFARFGVSGGLARQNAMLYATAALAAQPLAAALMIGLALVTMVATLGKGLVASDRDSLRHQVQADYVVTSKNGWDAFSRAAGDAAAAAPGVTVASSVRTEQAKVDGDEVRVDGIDSATIAAVHTYDWVSGSSATPATLGPDDLQWAKSHGFSVATGSVLNPAGQPPRRSRAGIYTQPSSAIDLVSGSIGIHSGPSTRPSSGRNAYTFLNVRGGRHRRRRARWSGCQPYPDLESRPGTTGSERRVASSATCNVFLLAVRRGQPARDGEHDGASSSSARASRCCAQRDDPPPGPRMIRQVDRHRADRRGTGLPLGVFLAYLRTKALSNQGVSFAIPARCSSPSSWSRSRSALAAIARRAGPRV